MNDEPTSKDRPAGQSRRRDHLRLLPSAEVVVDITRAAPAPRPRTIGRLIAQTALIADSAMQRRRLDREDPAAHRGLTNRLLRRFR